MESNVSRMYSHIFSFVESCLVGIAAEFDICDHLSLKAMNAKELSAILGMNEHNLSRLLRGLSVMEILREEENETYSVTMLGETLTSKSSHSVKNYANAMTREFYTACSGLYESVATGQPSFEIIYGMPFYEYLKNNDRRREIFFKSMTELHNLEATIIYESINFDSFNRIIDVGGGNGDFIRYILSKNPHASGVLFDLEHMVKGVESALVAEFGDRCTAVGGNFLESVPADGDCYILRKVMFNWNDEKALEILRRIRKVMKHEAKLFIIEPTYEKYIGFSIDFLVMAQMSGTVRSIEQFRKLLSNAELQINAQIVMNNSFHDIIEVSAI